MGPLRGRVPLTATRPATTDWASAALYPGVTPASRLAGAAARSPERTAVVDASDRTRLSYHDLAAAAAGLAAALRARGVGAGDVVTMQLPNWWEAVVVFHAVVRLGAVLNPVVPIYRERELGFITRQSRPTVIVTPHRFRGFDHFGLARRLADEADAPLIVAVRPSGSLPAGVLTFDGLLEEGYHDGTHESAPVGQPADIALLLYTSGMTADPKGVLHSHQTLGYEVQSFIDLFSLEADDAVFMPSPITHITGLLYGLLLPVVIGCTVVLLDVWDPVNAVDLIER